MMGAAACGIECPLLMGISFKVLVNSAQDQDTSNPPRAAVPAYPAVPFFPPNQNGGSNLDIVSTGLGEPLNVIISALSSPPILTSAGFLNYMRSVGFSTECLGVSLGALQAANLGDGNGPVNQTILLRQDFGDPVLGTCFETIAGGNHLRMYRQNGPEHNTSALFLSVSREEALELNHTISPDGYNLGRDMLIDRATSGMTSFGGVTYSAKVEDISGLLEAGTSGVNHGIAQDGVVQLLTVTIVSQLSTIIPYNETIPAQVPV